MPAQQCFGTARACRRYYWMEKTMKRQDDNVVLFRAIPERRLWDRCVLPFVTEEGLVTIDRREIVERRSRINGLRGGAIGGLADAPSQQT
jgi:hypothetical protein